MCSFFPEEGLHRRAWPPVQVPMRQVLRIPGYLALHNMRILRRMPIDGEQILHTRQNQWRVPLANNRMHAIGDLLEVAQNSVFLFIIGAHAGPIDLGRPIS